MANVSGRTGDQARNANESAANAGAGASITTGGGGFDINISGDPNGSGGGYEGGGSEGGDYFSDISSEGPTAPAYDPNPDKRRQSEMLRIQNENARKKQEAKQQAKQSVSPVQMNVAAAPKAPSVPAAPASSFREVKAADGSSVMIDEATGEIQDNAAVANALAPGDIFQRGSVIMPANAPAQAAPKAPNAKTPKAPAVPAIPQIDVDKLAQENKDKSGPTHPMPPKAVQRQRQRNDVERVLQQYEEGRVDQANERNIETYRNYSEWRANNPGADPSEYLNKIRPKIDNESFANMGKLPENQDSENLDEYSERVEREGFREEAEENPVIQAKKDTHKQDHLISETARDMIKGFFHIEGMRVERDDAGNEYIRWPERVEQVMTQIFSFVNCKNTIENQRNLMRSIRMYASMSIDRQGQMFKQDADEWSLTEDEAIMIMQLMLRSCVEYGTPFAIVDASAQLGGTNIFPCGVVPKVVADFWTGKGSNLRNRDGASMTSAQLVQQTQNEWTRRTRPAIVRNLTGDKVGQRVVIEDMARAVSILDGMSADRFSERYGVKTELDYMISEWQDANAQYAAAMNDYVDADAVRARQDRILEGYTKRIDKSRGVEYTYDDDGNLSGSFQHTRPGWVSGLTLATKLMRGGSIAFNVPVIISAFAEHGVGNVYTAMTIATINKAYGTNYKMSDFANEAMRSDEAMEAFQCVKELYDAFGPGAVRLFAQEKIPYTKENVMKFASENLKVKMGEKAERFSQRLDKLTHGLMVADYAFRRSDLSLWFNAYLASNAVAIRSQQKLAEQGIASEREIPLTPEEIESSIMSMDMGTFFAQAMGTDAGINAYQMMRANNIGQKSPMSEFANQFLSDHAVTEFAITAFVDTFPKYGLNFAYMLMPFSRTLSYLKAHSNYEQQVGGENADLLIGGNIEDFQLGLRMNLIYDSFTFGGRSLLVGAMVGIIINMLGFDPPDEDIDKFNVSKWKIGSKVGWGDGHGIEIQMAWWMNDLTLLSMPFAYLTAGGLSTGDWSLAKDLMLDSLGDTLSGNVLMDFARTMSHWREDYIEFNKMINEPNYDGPRDMWTYLQEEAAMATWKAIGKMNPIDPLVNTFNRDTLFAGEDARNKDFRHVYRRSDDPELDEFYRKNNVMDRVSYDEYMRRKYSSTNLLFALVNNIENQSLNAPFLSYDDKKTGFFWWDMPARTTGDPLDYAWLSEFYMDLNNIPDEIPGDTPAEKEVNFKDMRARQVLEWIDKFDGAVNQAKVAGFTIPPEAREAATNYCYAQISALKAEHVAKIESGELVLWSEEEREANQAMWDEINNKWNVYIYQWLKNDEIPSYATTYEQLLTDWDVTYVWRENGQAAPIWASLMPGMTDAVYEPKGNHPTSFAPLTVVDTRNRGYNAETINSWYAEGDTGSNLQWIFDNIGNTEIMFGQDKGKTANDVIFNKQLSGEYKTLEGPTTMGHRSWVATRDEGLPESVRNITEENHEGGKLGELGEYNQDVEDALSGKNKDKKTNNAKGGTPSTTYPSYYPRSTYGINSRSGGGGTNYNPKIYSNPRSVNADKAATMYTKSPIDARNYIYLHPNFSTKGSREAYKRQDI